MPDAPMVTVPAVTESPHRLSTCVLGSGSKGNAIYVSDGETALLVDAGFSGKEIERRMASQGLCPEKLQAVIVSHEHGDHISGVGVLSRRYKIPVHITEKTYHAATPKIGRLAKHVFFECGNSFDIGALKIHPFPISHDAIDPAGFTIEKGGVKLGLATDLGMVTALVATHLKACQILILEANHDLQMLINGPYSWPLKQRVKSRIGHLSNEDLKELLTQLMHDRLLYVILGHISQQNNTPAIVHATIKEHIALGNTRLMIAHQEESTPLITATVSTPRKDET